MAANQFEFFVSGPRNGSRLHLCPWHDPVTGAALSTATTRLGRSE